MQSTVRVGFPTSVSLLWMVSYRHAQPRGLSPMPSNHNQSEQHTHRINTAGHVYSLSSYHWTSRRPNYHLCMFVSSSSQAILLILHLFTYFPISQCITSIFLEKNILFKICIIKIKIISAIQNYILFSFVIKTFTFSVRV